MVNLLGSRVGYFNYAVSGNVSQNRNRVVDLGLPTAYIYGGGGHPNTGPSPCKTVNGQPISQFWGLKTDGMITSQEEIDTSPRQLFDDEVQVGDLKYADLNNDGLIDSNDQKVIGNSSPRFDYSVSINLRYRNFDLTIVGTGRASYDTALTNKYFWNGWSTGTYSHFVRDNIGGDYPRLAYVKSNNNFQNSSFWLRDGGYFKIQNVELGYNLRFRSQSVFKGLRVFLRGANLCTISGIKDVDPENINAGVTTYPLYRTFTAGFKFTF
mgnify:CR=1 FL=1